MLVRRVPFLLFTLLLICSPSFSASNRQDCEKAWDEMFMLSKARLTRWAMFKNALWNLPRALRGRPAITPRHAGWVLHDLGLARQEGDGFKLTKDLRNLQIADIGTGLSDLGGAMNSIEGMTGTHVVSVDIAPYGAKIKNADFVQADARKLPFADKSKDLTISNWLIPNFLPLKGKPFAPDAPMRIKVTQMLNEMIRVTKSGGEVRFTISGLQDPRTVTALLRENPRVGKIDFETTTVLGQADMLKTVAVIVKVR